MAATLPTTVGGADQVNQPPTLAEQRGTSGLLISAGDTQWYVCLDISGVGAAGGGGTLPPAPPTGDALDVLYGNTLGGAADAKGVLHLYVGVFGRSGPDVTSVEVRRADGVVVTASVQNGWFAAWWPITDEGPLPDTTTLIVTSTDGSARQQTISP